MTDEAIEIVTENITEVAKEGARDHHIEDAESQTWIRTQ